MAKGEFSVNRRRVVGFLLILTLLTVPFLTLWYIHSLETKVPKFTPGKYLYDDGRMSDREDEKVITGLLQELDMETNAKLLVVTVRRLPDMTIEEYTDKIFEKWMLDKVSILSERENALLVFDKKTDDVILKATSGLNDVLTAERFETVKRRCFDTNISEKKYAEAVEDTTRAIVYSIAKKYDADIINLHFTSLYGNPFLEFGIIFGVLLLCMFSLVVLYNKGATKK